MDWIKTINIVSLCLQFLSFWLAAPEILGTAWLQKAEAIIKRTIMKIPNIILMFISLIIGHFFANGIHKYEIRTVIFFGIIFVFVLVFSKKMRTLLNEKISTPLLEKLIINDSFRFTLLKTAALMFTVGFILQIIAIAYS
ncbi:hypothetical protein [Tenacibaculum retecalamus]|uniref:hypothetical protein n=1 Tax=Tenacibaculum retecalamus TaxID=3018315 RepID=UPI0023D8E2F3|nr:hypothetical protein [Tenacibaculum retecalamus]WBX70310.1 hypothetical protein PG912_08450 [Tenacibaculum retecalamus]